MIIVDLNQIMISNLMVQINGRNAVELSEDLVRHMVLNSLRGHYKRFRDYGEMIIACDSGMCGAEKYFQITRPVERKSEINQDTIGLKSLRLCPRLKMNSKNICRTKSLKLTRLKQMILLVR